MDRSIIYPAEQTRGYDFASFEHDVLVGLGALAQDTLGQPITVVSGCQAGATNPASLAVSLTAGRIYTLTSADATSQGDIVADATTIMQQGMVAAQSITLSTSGLSPGQSRWALIQCSFQQQDIVRAYPSADPNGGVMAFYNTANPQQPLNGQNGNGGVLPTARLGIGTISVVYGTAASTGTEQPPLPTSSAAPLFLVDLSYGQQQVISSQILVAGPSVGTGVPSTYPAAPLLTGLLSSHHNGTPGQAPKINLSTETQGSLGVANGGTGASTPLQAAINIQVPDSANTPISSNYVVTSSDNGKVLQVAASNLTIQLSPAANAASGTTVSIQSNYTATIQTLGGATIYGYPDWAGTSIALFPGAFVTFRFDGSNWILKHWNAPPGLFIQRIKFTAAGTYNPSTFARNIRAYVQGAGGAGGGAAASTAGNVCVGSGGNAGDLAVGWAAVGSYAVQVGTGGVGASGAAGGAGGSSGLGSILSAYGGTGGLVGVLAASCVATSSYSFRTIIQADDYYRSGDIGQIGVATGVGDAAGGAGGSSTYGGGAAYPSTGNSAAAGGNAGGYGAGGSGGASSNGSGAVAGGNGSGGIVIIDEYT